MESSDIPMDIDISTVEQVVSMQQMETDGEMASVSIPFGKTEPMEVDGESVEVEEPEEPPKPSTSDPQKYSIYPLTEYSEEYWKQFQFVLSDGEDSTSSSDEESVDTKEDKEQKEPSDQQEAEEKK